MGSSGVLVKYAIPGVGITPARITFAPTEQIPDIKLASSISPDILVSFPITTKGCFDINRTKALGDSTRYNVDATLMAMNCKYIKNCTAIGIINYTETAGNATGTKQFAGIDITNGLDSNESDAYITNCTSKVVMNTS